MRLRSLRIIIFSLLASGPLAACAATPAPIVDMNGVDIATYNRDLAECVNDNAAKAVSVGNGVTRCIEGKGYKVLVGY